MHSLLLEKFIGELKDSSASAPALDLACGEGRNGIFCVKHGIPTVFSDRNQSALQTVSNTLHNLSTIKEESLASFWDVDFESDDDKTHLTSEQFSSVLVFRYLHRPLMNQIKDSIKSGGYIIYETFTTQQAEFGRPKNPDFLLTPGELKDIFSGWEILHSFEGVTQSETSTNQQAIAQIVAKKP